MSEKFETNRFEFIGRVNYVEIKYTDKGTVYTRVLAGKKNVKTDSYDSFPVTYFGESAEKFAEYVKKGDTVQFVGYLACNKFSKDGKETEKLELIGKDFHKLKYDEDLRKYVEIPVETKQEEKLGTEEVPW